MNRGPDVGTRLARALEASGPDVTVTRRTATRWASVTFTGARHELQCTAPASPALEQWLADLPEAEFAIPGHLVADLAITGMTATATRIDWQIEALTVEA
jgi:hypothetical protein